MRERKRGRKEERKKKELVDSQEMFENNILMTYKLKGSTSFNCDLLI